jgi:hypothetical protein
MEYNIKKLKKEINDSSEERRFWKRECRKEYGNLINLDWREYFNNEKCMTDEDKERLRQLTRLFNDMTTKQEITILCSIRAHLRGKLHMTSCWSDQPWVPSGRSSIRTFTLNNVKLDWTMEDQAKLVEKYLEAYKLE